MGMGVRVADKPTDKPKSIAAKPDLASLGGLVLAFGGILAGLLLEGGKIRDVAQVTAAMIVLGGTIGAVMVSNPMPVLLSAAKKLPTIFLHKTQDTGEVIDEIVSYAVKARRGGIVSLENDADGIADPFLRKALSLAVDGTDLAQIRGMMELEISVYESHGEAEAKVYESAGGYAPTIGIIGAVLGLIQVMKNLANIDEVGRGIAVAFVATVYGVASANIFFLPAATKLRARMQHTVQLKELMLEGVGGIVEGMNVKLIRTKLEAYQQAGAGAAKSSAKERKPADQPAAAEV